MKSVELLKAISRLFALQFLSFALLELPSLPEYVSIALHQSHYPVNSYSGTLAAAAALFRFFINIVFATLFWFGAGTLAKVVGKNLFTIESTQPTEKRET